MSPGLLVIGAVLAAQTVADAPITGPDEAPPAAWRAALIADGLDDLQRARLGAALQSARVELVPAAQVDELRAELSAHGVDCDADATDCLARVSVLADVDRALRVWPAEGALDVLVVDATPRRARARLLQRDSDVGWRSALEAALALAPLDEPVALPADAPPPAPTHVTIVNAASPEEGPGLGLVVGAVALGAAGVGVVLASVLGGFALASIAASNEAHFQDDAVLHAGEANQRLTWGAAVLAGSVAVAGVGAALVALDVSGDGR